MFTFTQAFMWNEFEGTVFCNTNPDPLPANVSGVVEAFNCQQNITVNLNWYNYDT